DASSFIFTGFVSGNLPCFDESETRTTQTGGPAATIRRHTMAGVGCPKINFPLDARGNLKTIRGKLSFGHSAPAAAPFHRGTRLVSSGRPDGVHSSFLGIGRMEPVGGRGNHDLFQPE